jgi:dGTPase
MDHEEEILTGTLSTSLTDLSSFKPQIDDILALTIENLYQHPDVVHKEIAGYKILKEVLDAIITASVNDLNNQDTSYDRLILQLLPKELLVSNDLYYRLLSACGFVASLTDTKAVELFGIINGRT